MALGAFITAGAGLLGGVANFFQGRKMQKEAERLIADFTWQDLENPYENLQVSTMGSDLRREEAARTTGTQVDALRAGGTRGIIGGLGRVEAQNNQVNREIAANLDEQQKRLDAAKAQQDVVNQNMIEKRQADELAGYGAMMNTGLGIKQQGMGGMINAIGMAGSAFDGMKKPVTDPKTGVITYPSGAQTDSSGMMTGFKIPYGGAIQYQGNASTSSGFGGREV